MYENVITPLGNSWRNHPGHWHWIEREQRDGIARVNIEPPRPGSLTHNCLCPAEPTHKVTKEGFRWTIGEPLITHRAW